MIIYICTYDNYLTLVIQKRRGTSSNRKRNRAEYYFTFQ